MSSNEGGEKEGVPPPPLSTASSTFANVGKDAMAQVFHAAVRLCSEINLSQAKLNSLSEDFNRLNKEATGLCDSLKYIVSTSFSSSAVSNILAGPPSSASLPSLAVVSNSDTTANNTTPSRSRTKMVSIACCQTSFSSSSEDENDVDEREAAGEDREDGADLQMPVVSNLADAAADATSNDPDMSLQMSATRVGLNEEEENEHYKSMFFAALPSDDDDEEENENDDEKEKLVEIINVDDEADSAARNESSTEIQRKAGHNQPLSEDDKLERMMENALKTSSGTELSKCAVSKAYKSTAAIRETGNLNEMDEYDDDDDDDDCEMLEEDEMTKQKPMSPIAASMAANKQESESDEDVTSSDDDDEKVKPSPIRKKKVVASSSSDEEANADATDREDEDEKEPIPKAKRDEWDDLGNDLLHSDSSDKENSGESDKSKRDDTKDKRQKKESVSNPSVVRKKVVLMSSSSSGEVSSDDSNKSLVKKSSTPNRRVQYVASTSEEDAVKSEKMTPIKAKKRLYIEDDDDEDNLIRLSSDEEKEDDDNESRSSSSSSFKFRGKKPKKKRQKRSDSKESEDSDDSDVILEDDMEDGELNESALTRRKLRKIKQDEALTKETKDALQAERDRKKRIEEKRRLEAEALAAAAGGVAAEQIEAIPSPSKNKHLYLDVDKQSKKLSLKVDECLSRCLKPHQVEGVKFMYDSCYESLSLIKENDGGGGCLLAHCMGLGKTLQVVALIHTLLANQRDTKVKRILILLPVNVQTNWRSEIRKWTRDCRYQIPVYELSMTKEKTDRDIAVTRLRELRTWYNEGGVCLIGYTLFASLVEPTASKRTKLPEEQMVEFCKYLLKPGADLVVCDEGHYLKNYKTGLSKAVMKIHTRRRIVLTGTPLQNNLNEYHCMVDFVKPNLLGNLKEFRNRFVNPIESGQHKDATQGDVIMMKRRAHVLHQMLDECVQRKDFDVIRKFLPAKKEYVLSIRLSDEQISLYKRYLDFRNLGKLDVLKNTNVGAMLFADFQELYRVWTHPWVFKLYEERLDHDEQKQAEKDFVAEDDEDDVDEEETRASTSESNESIKKKHQTKRMGQLESDPTASTSAAKAPKERWWASHIEATGMKFELEAGGKLIILDRIITLCKQKGDKLLVFSQSLLSLDLIEDYLEYKQMAKKDKWIKDVDYFRLDGSTDQKTRHKCVNQFNKPSNTRARLFLISTKAGGIGINLVGANRCVIFDACWNPSHDTQSIFRIYRFGQIKNVFVYRLLSEGTMEERIYQRQVTKQGLSQRVIDEHQLDRHFTKQELQELYRFEPDTRDEMRPLPKMPDDDLLKDVFVECRKWLVKYHEHDSLLENKTDEVLTDEERKAAWEEFEREKNRLTAWNTSIIGAIPPGAGALPGQPGYPIPGYPNGIPGIQTGIPGYPNGIPGIQTGIPGYPNGIPPGFNINNPQAYRHNHPNLIAGQNPAGFNTVNYNQFLGNIVRNAGPPHMPQVYMPNLPPQINPHTSNNHPNVPHPTRTAAAPAAPPPPPQPLRQMSNNVTKKTVSSTTAIPLPPPPARPPPK